MPNLLNLIYLLAGAILSPWILHRALTTGRYRQGFASKYLGRIAHPRLEGNNRPRVWFHGVSVGEIHLLRPLVAAFRKQYPDWDCVISTTTDTGFAEANKHFPQDIVIYFPFDFTWAVRGAFQRVQPRLIVLAEGDLWPNFLRIASEKHIPLAVVNARMSPRSASRYLRLRFFVYSLFSRLDLIAAQNSEYAEHYRALGARRVVVTGNIKYDGVQTDRQNPRTGLHQLFGLNSQEIIWVAGSTQEPEEKLAIDIYRRARAQHPRLRLIVVPRHPERFDEVARLLERTGLPVWRRSSQAAPPPDAVILVDTMGELGAVWGLADLAYVGGSLDGKRGGQNMIEPAAYGASVFFGPHTWNFKRDVEQLLAHQAAIQISDADALEQTVLELLGNESRRQQLGEAARRFVLSQQGATQATLDLLTPYILASASG